MKRLSLDSSFIISYLSGDQKAKSFLEQLEYEELFLPSIVEMEVKWGKREISKFEDLEKVGFDSSDVQKTIEMKEHLKQKGEMINRLDLMIAAQASRAQTVLVTQDKDFEKLEDFGNFRCINFREETE
jgi:predicted nucleic acid-binding protein